MGEDVPGLRHSFVVDTESVSSFLFIADTESDVFKVGYVLGSLMACLYVASTHRISMI